MKKYRGCIRTDRQGSDCEFEFDMPDDATEDEVYETAKECAFDFIDWWYESDQETEE